MTRHFLTACFLTAAALALTILPAAAQTPDRGVLPPKHDSNSLHKLGSSLQYPFRKAGENISKSTQKGAKDVQYGTKKNSENLSVTTHRVTGKRSVVRRENGMHRHNTVVTPKGHLYRVHS